MTISTRSARRGAAVLASGLLLGVVPGLVSGEAAHAAVPTAIDVSTSPAATVAGGSITINAHLTTAGAPLPNQTVHLYQQAPGRAATEIQTPAPLQTDANGDVSLTGTVQYNVTFIASYRGDGVYDPSGDTVSLAVRAKVSIKDSGGKKKSGYRLYKANSKAKTSVKVAPSKSGKKVTFRLQKLIKGAWKTIGKKTVKLKKGSKAKLSHVGFAGSQFRIRVEYKGDALNAKNVSKWNYQIFK